ncbi:MAG: polysaccharide pyruvyl transferase family protein, partial [Acidimicrobiia bacterium]
MRIALSGYYGFGNAGDDAILLAILDQIEAVMPGADVTVVTYPHGDVEAVTRLTGARAVDGRDLGEAVEAIRQADLLIVGGGGLVQDYLPADLDQVLTSRHGNLAFWTGLALVARTAGVPVATWAIGIGPLSTPAGREQAGLLLGEAGLVCVRDGSSAKLAGELGVPEERVVVAADPVFGLAPPETDPFERLLEVDDLPSDGSTRIVVSVRSWSGEERREGELASALDRLVEAHDADVLFLPFQQSGKGLDNDALVSTRVAARMRHTGRRAVISTPLSPFEKLGVTAHADLVIGMRLHSIMGAAAGGVPFVAIAYDPKVATAAAELGLADLVVDADPLSAGEVIAAAATALGLDAGRTEEYRRRGRALHDRARLAAPAIAGFAERPQVPPIRPAVVDLLGSVAVERAVDLVRVEDERDRALAAEGATALELQDLRTAYDKLAAEYQSFMDTKVVRAATSVWRARDGLRRLPSDTAAAARRAARRVLPPGARRVLRDAVGGAAVPARAELTPEELAVARARIDTDLARIVEAHAGAPGFVILPPGIGWDVELFQRPQQMALAFAALGYPVLYHLDDRYRDGRLGFERREDGVYVGFVPDELTDLLHRIPSPIYLSYVYNFDWRRHLEHPVTVYEHIDHLEVFEHV